jgi:hypothetical protein
VKHYELHFFYGSFSTILFLIIVIIGSVAFFFYRALVDLVNAGWVGGWILVLVTTIRVKKSYLEIQLAVIV